MKITAHEKSYIAKCVEASMLLKEVMAARAVIDSMECGEGWPHANQTIDNNDVALVTYDAIRKENEGYGL